MEKKPCDAFRPGEHCEGAYDCERQIGLQARKKKKDIKPWDIVERAGSPVEL